MRLLSICLSLASLAWAEEGVLARVAAHAGRYEALSRQIWESPETGFQEYKSSVRLRDELRAAGFSIEEGVAGMPTAFIASWGSGKPVIALLGEFDALPGLSQKESARQEAVTAGGPGHGCGHNLLGSGAALAAVAVKEEMASRRLSGTLRYYGTPAEEGGGGKIYLLHAGRFRDVDAVLTWHPADVNSVTLRSCLANNNAKFRFHGSAAHAALHPEQGRSALDGALLMLHGVEMLREHIPAEARMHYIISNGGTAANVVPAFSEVSLGARHPDAAELSRIWDRILKCAQAGALATETRLEVAQGSSYANLLPNDALADVAARAMKRAGGYQFTSAERAFADALRATLAGGSGQMASPAEVAFDRSEGADSYSTDVGDVSWNVPTVAVNAATNAPGVPLHSWQAVACSGSSIGRKGMLVAARTLALTAMDLLEHPAEVAAARASFDRRRAGRSWITRIPAGAVPPVSR